MTLDPRIEAAARILAMWSDDTARHTIDVIARNALAAADAVDPLRGMWEQQVPTVEIPWDDRPDD